MKFVKLNTKIYSYGFYRNLFHIFPSSIVFSTYFRTLYDFSRIITKMKKTEIHHTVMVRNSARGHPVLARPAGQNGMAGPAEQVHGAGLVRSPHAGRPQWRESPRLTGGLGAAAVAA
jgi:hypothetical protein